ncbi:MAG: hypothetical protein MHPSP_001518, partial [Paramarteilia canceri]
SSDDNVSSSNELNLTPQPIKDGYLQIVGTLFVIFLHLENKKKSIKKNFINDNQVEIIDSCNSSKNNSEMKQYHLKEEIYGKNNAIKESDITTDEANAEKVDEIPKSDISETNEDFQLNTNKNDSTAISDTDNSKKGPNNEHIETKILKDPIISNIRIQDSAIIESSEQITEIIDQNIPLKKDKIIKKTKSSLLLNVFKKDSGKTAVKSDINRMNKLNFKIDKVIRKVDEKSSEMFEEKSLETDGKRSIENMHKNDIAIKYSDSSITLNSVTKNIQLEKSIEANKSSIDKMSSMIDSLIVKSNDLANNISNIELKVSDNYEKKSELDLNLKKLEINSGEKFVS